MRTLPVEPKSLPLPEWCQAYFVAVLEPDNLKALVQIERAADAIADRLSQLRCGVPEYPQELQDLNSALIYLRLLSKTSTLNLENSINSIEAGSQQPHNCASPPSF